VINHSGNVHYRKVVAANQHRYQGTDADKRNLVQEIFDRLTKDEGYQFMERNEESGEYTQVDDDRVLKNKIPKCFRDTIQAANANSQHVDASIPADDDHLSNASLSLGSIISAEHPHQSNERRFEGIVFLGNVSYSQGSSSADGSVIADNETDSGSSVLTSIPGGSSSTDGSVLSDSGSSLSTFTPTFPEAQEKLDDINFDEFFWETAWEPTRSAVTMQRPDVVKETIDAFSRMNVREKDVSSKPDFAKQ